MQGDVKSGKIKKQGHIIKNMKERHLVLTYAKLSYYTKINGEMKGEIKIHKNMRPYNNKTFKYQPCFTVADEKGKIYNIVTENPEENESWISSIESIVALHIGSEKKHLFDNFRIVNSIYIHISELIWAHDESNISKIVETLGDLMNQGVMSFTEVLQMIASIEKHRPRFTSFYSNLLISLVRAQNMTLTEEQCKILKNMDYILIRKDLIKGDIPDRFQDWTDEELYSHYQQTELDYIIMHDELQKFQENFADINPSDYNKVIAKAAENGSSQIYQFLLKKGIKLAQDDLVKALYGENQEIIQTINIKSIEVTPNLIDEIVENHHLTAFRMIDYSNDYSYSWHSCLVSYNFKQFFEKIYATIDLNAPDNTASTALIEAAKYSITSIVKTLCDFGAFIDSANHFHQTPFMEAVLIGNLTNASYLIDMRSNIEVKNNRGLTSLMICAESDNERAVTFLLSKGANINNVDDRHQNALIKSTIKNCVKSTRALLKGGADPNLMDDDGYAPIHYCAMSGLYDIAQALIEFGVDMNIQDINGVTPIFHAINYKHNEIIELLSKSGANYEEPNREGKTPLKLLIEMENSEAAINLIKTGLSITGAVCNYYRKLAYEKSLKDVVCELENLERTLAY